MNYTRMLAVGLLLLAATGCSLKKTASHVVADMAWSGQGVLEAQPDVELARSSYPAIILSSEVMLQSAATDRTTAALLAKAYGQYAYGFFEEDWLRFDGRDSGRARTALADADRFYRKGMEYGLGALKRSTDFAKALNGAFPSYERAVARFGRDDAPLLFWTAFCWGGWINLHRDDPQAVADMPRVQALVDRVIALDPTFEMGLALSFKGVTLAARPRILGGNPDAAKELFERAFAVAPDYLMHHVLFAQYYAVAVQDRDLFSRELKAVAAADPMNMPSQALANSLARRRAEILLKQVDQLF